MSIISISFNVETDDQETLSKVKRLVSDMMCELGDGGWFETYCEENGIDYFCSSDYNIEQK